MQHLIYCKKCNHHTTVHHLEWTAISCQGCGSEIENELMAVWPDLMNSRRNLKATNVKLQSKIENRDLNLAHRDRLIDILETNNRALTQMLESLIGKPLHLRGQISKPCPDCNYEEWATQEDAKREVAP